jgi:guanylate kinase
MGEAAGRTQRGCVTGAWYQGAVHRRDHRLLSYAREMRQDPTPAEDLLWWRLRGGELGFHFRRQHPVGPYIVDFACLKARLVVETDGDSHENEAKDARRDRWLAEHGWRVIRFDDSEVRCHLEESLDHIWRELHGPDA